MRDCVRRQGPTTNVTNLEPQTRPTLCLSIRILSAVNVFIYLFVEFRPEILPSCT